MAKKIITPFMIKPNDAVYEQLLTLGEDESILNFNFLLWKNETEDTYHGTPSCRSLKKSSFLIAVNDLSNFDLMYANICTNCRDQTKPASTMQSISLALLLDTLRIKIYTLEMLRWIKESICEKSQPESLILQAINSLINLLYNTRTDTSFYEEIEKQEIEFLKTMQQKYQQHLTSPESINKLYEKMQIEKPTDFEYVIGILAEGDPEEYESSILEENEIFHHIITTYSIMKDESYFFILLPKELKITVLEYAQNKGLIISFSKEVIKTKKEIILNKEKDIVDVTKMLIEDKYDVASLLEENYTDFFNIAILLQ